MDVLFAPLGSKWQPVSDKLASMRRLIALPLIALAAAVGVIIVVAVFGTSAWGVGLIALLVVLALASGLWLSGWAGRNARSWGYAENADDLLVTGGVMFRRLVAIPYGRMQFVDVKAGPVQRWYGIATVTLHTASTATAAQIPGVLADDARALRNRLTEMGEAHGAGL